jgi:hypothetical protein
MDRRAMVEELLSLAEWTSVLKLAAMWQMEGLLGIAVRRMRSLEVHELEGWMKVLDLSITPELSSARALAIERLPSSREINGVEMVLLARKYRVEKWLMEGYRQLIHREPFFSDEEAGLLGDKTVIKLCRLRDGHSKSKIETMNANHSVNRHNPTSTGSIKVDTTKIEREFALEFWEMRWTWVPSVPDHTERPLDSYEQPLDSDAASAVEFEMEQV